MPLKQLQFRPGVNREGTTLANEGGWFECDKIRFRSGYPEKIGGWGLLNGSFATFLGTCRSLWNWVTLKGYNVLGVGTSLKFYVANGGTFYDITPLRQTTTNTTTFAAAYSTLNGSINDSVTTIVVTSGASFVSTGGYIKIDTEQISYTSVSGNNILGCVRGVNGSIAAAHTSGADVGSTGITVTDTTVTSLQPGDFVTFSGATSVGGIVVNNEYQIATQVAGTVYTIVAAFYSTSASGNGGGSVVAKYQINSGAIIAGAGTGWGSGPWPEYMVATLTTPFTTTDTSPVVTVAQTAHGLTSGDFVYFYSISDADVNGIPSAVMIKAFEVTVVNANSYTVNVTINGTAYNATSSGGSQGGTVIVYTPSGTARGWGAGFTSSSFVTQLRLWSQANFGEFLIFSPRGGPLYMWQPGSGTAPNYNVRGVILSSASSTPAGWATTVTDTSCPSIVNQVLVADAARIVIAFGCNDYPAIDPSGVLDPLLVRWSAQESYTEWFPTATNQARSYRLSHGSQIVGALQTRQEIIVWTDSAIYGMQYLGPPYVWGFTLLADNISIASPNSMATASGVTYWMGTDKFYVYSGRVETLPSSLRSYVFDDINRGQQFQTIAGTNEAYSEIWWFYCSRNSDIIDRYVIFNYLDRVWYYGVLGRTAWLDSSVSDYPIAATYNNLLVQHETSTDDGDVTNGQQPLPITAYVQSSDFDIEDGHNYGFVWRIIPDITFDGSTSANGQPNHPSATFTLRPRQNPGAPYNTAPTPTVTSNNGTYSNAVQTYNVQEFTEIVYTRVRGRQLAFKVESNTLGTQWQLGVPRIDVRPDGRRA